MDRVACRATVRAVAKNQTRLGDLPLSNTYHSDNKGLSVSENSK